MIIVDIETSGLDPEKHGICEIGAIDFFNPRNTFFQESRIDEDELIDENALMVNGKSFSELRDYEKPSQKSMIENFIEWHKNARIRNFGGENPHFDVNFIKSKIKKYKIEYNIPARMFDLHSIAQARYFEIYGKFLIEEENRRSSMSLKEILEFCGIKDERKFHSGLEDAKLEAECFSRILRGENLLKEYLEFPIPIYLLKNRNKK